MHATVSAVMLQNAPYNSDTLLHLSFEPWCCIYVDGNLSERANRLLLESLMVLPCTAVTTTAYKYK
jgi:hypothetical protein